MGLGKPFSNSLIGESSETLALICELVCCMVYLWCLLYTLWEKWKTISVNAMELVIWSVFAHLPSIMGKLLWIEKR